MAKLDKAQVGALKRLMQNDAWDVLTQAYENRVKRLQSEPTVGQNAFEELRMLHKQQGKIEGLVEFFSDIEKMAFDD